MKITVLGAGAWGTALAHNYAARHQVVLWTRNGEHLAELAAQRTNRRYLPGFAFPVANLRAPLPPT